MIVVGLDLSLTHTGYAIVKDGGEVLASGVIKSKPVGDRPMDETKRLLEILNGIETQISSTERSDAPIDLVVIEGIAFAARNTTSLAQLAGLNYLVRASLSNNSNEFMIVAPTTLKKFITSSGKGDKDMMMMEVYKNYGFESMDNNECDAYSLAVAGLAVLGKPVKKLGVPQEEVIKLLKKQI